ncbi:MAG: TIGR01906 family membrane protein [Anaerotignaceae bacterium]
MRALNYFLGVIISLSIILILLLTSVQNVALRDYEFYRSQYIENNVYANIAISEDDLMDVTEQLINYMNGKRDDISVITTIDGEEKEFFNQREKDHMVDVRNLITGGKKLRIMLIGIVVILLALMKWLKAPIVKAVSKSSVVTIAAVIVGSGILGYIISRNFSQAFTIFHEILFTNELWILDYSTDRLLNMVPEVFFINIAIKIGVTFLFMVMVYFIISVLSVLIERKKII